MDVYPPQALARAQPHATEFGHTYVWGSDSDDDDDDDGGDTNGGGGGRRGGGDAAAGGEGGGEGSGGVGTASSRVRLADHRFLVSSPGAGAATVVLRLRVVRLASGQLLLHVSSLLWVYNCTGLPLALRVDPAQVRALHAWS